MFMLNIQDPPNPFGLVGRGAKCLEVELKTQVRDNNLTMSVLQMAICDIRLFILNLFKIQSNFRGDFLANLDRQRNKQWHNSM